MSGISISIRNNFPQVIAAMNRYGAEVGDRAMVRALNASVSQGKPAMARQISNEFRVSIAQVKSRLLIERARSKGGSVRFQATLMATRAGGLHGNDWRGMNLINFVVGARPKRSKKGVVSQLRFQIKRTGGRKTIPGAFIATSRRTGGTAVFVRQGKSRMPIETKTTIDIAQMFNTRRVNQVVRAEMIRRFAANFARELRAINKGFVK